MGAALWGGAVASVAAASTMGSLAPHDSIASSDAQQQWIADPLAKLKGEVRGGDSKDRLRVPMIVHWPEHVPAGRVSRAPWSPPDFAPTVMEIAYGKPAPSFASVSILPVLLGQAGTILPDLPDVPNNPAGPPGRSQ